MSAPPPSNYPGYPPPQTGYPGSTGQSGYPPSQPGYPPSQPGYPPSQPGYPPSQPGYPPSQPGYPPSQPGYPPSQPGYPPSQPGYPPSQPGYPQSQPGYPQSQPGYPPSQPGYPPSQPGYPPSQQGHPPAQSAQSGYPATQPPQGGYPPPQSSYPIAQGGGMAPPGPPSGYQMQPGVSTPAYPGTQMAPASRPSGVPPPPRPCTSKIEFRISCKNILDRDITSTSDPMAAAFLKNGEKWVEIGRTERIKNSLNPEFSRGIQCDYSFEKVQNVKFKVYDVDNSTKSLSDDDFLGEMECTVGQIVAAKVFSKNLKRKGFATTSRGSITITAEEIDMGANESFLLSFSAKGLDKKDFLGKSDPYIEIKRKLPNGSYQLCFRTEFVHQSVNPTWRHIQLNKPTLCGSNLETELKILCYDHDDDGEHDLIGECTTSVVKMSEASSKPITWTLINAKKLAKKGQSYKGSGTLVLNSFKTLKQHTFLDFITRGTKLNFIVAVDFTASNGDPSKPESLHYIDQYRPNEYMSAISSVGTVLQDYDSDRMFPALGFGARIPPQYQVSHEFALNFNLSNPFCSGVDGLLQAYSACLPQIQLYGPTNVSPMINHAIRFATSAHQHNLPNDYFVLLILTDGVITDMNETAMAIVNASNLPLSIIIVGVGGADFGAMNFLDGDGGVLRGPNGQCAARDIVQFVPFRKYSSNPGYLTGEVLAEIPKQMTEYYKRRNMPPKGLIP